MDIFPQILISGSSGLVGSALRSRLQQENTPYAALVRESPPAVSGYLWDPYHFQFREEMRRLNGIRAVVNLAGDNLSEGRWTAEKKRKIRDSRIRTTQSLVELITQLDRPPEVLISASAVGYYGNCGEEIVTESSPPGQGFLAEVCQHWEAAAVKAADHGIRVVFLRFGVILAANGGALAKMLPLFRLGAGGNLGNGQQWMSWISLPDVVRVIDFCVKDHQIRGPVNVVSSLPVTNAEFTRTLAKQLHRPALVSAPAFLLRALFGEMADAALLSSTRAFPERLRQTGFVFDHPSLQTALQAVLPA